ncbi:MAG: hypothetical protein VW397_09265 [Candidatus Margulisiibacteriota bacterium]
MKPSLTIIGNGFIGQKFLQKHHSNFSTIITTSQQSPPDIFSSKHIYLDIYKDPPPLPNTDFCIITIPFSRRLNDPSAYFTGLKKSLKKIKNYKNIFFTSSTSVYPISNKHLTENDLIANNNRALYLNQCEDWLINQAESAIILRCSGICGYERNSFEKIKSGLIYDANLPVNLIHVDDIIQFIMTLIKSPKSSDIINLSCTDNPTKEAYYSYLCHKFNLKLPQFKTSKNAYKTISNQKLTRDYVYKMIYPSPLKFEF